MIRFTKCQAAGNDFLIVRWPDLEAIGLRETDLPALAQGICNRHEGVGADGLEVLDPPGIERGAADAAIRIFNSDGSEAEISGNGTRCVAATLETESPAGKPLRITTVAGLKVLSVVERSGPRFVFDMTMGKPSYDPSEVGCTIETDLGASTVTLVNVGNPQCVLFVEDFDSDWRSLGRLIERHPRFPKGTNVSFVKPLDPHTVDVRFWERGAGETISSGTGSTGAAVASVLSGKASSPVRVTTPAGDLIVNWEGEGVTMRGPATVVARGEYFGFPSEEPAKL